MTTEPSSILTLWGTPNSLFTGKTRSYLIKKGLQFRECYPSHPDFRARIVPIVKRSVVPVLEMPDGKIIQDTTEIFDFLEARYPDHPMTPGTSVQRVVAMLIDAFASEYLLTTAMHYRWSYVAQQELFLHAEFGRSTYLGTDREMQRAAGAKAMAYFSGFLPTLGVSPETALHIEAAYEELLDVLDVHFQAYPYLLGGRPSVGDFGLMGPLFAALARDPVPATLMKNRAPNVYRWTERMNLAAIADGEFAGQPEAYFDADRIPPTLEALLRLVFVDWGPGLAAEAQHYNSWVANQATLPSGHLVSANGTRRIHPTLGPIDYHWRGITMRRASAPHALWHFSRASEFARGLSGDARTRLDTLLQRTGGLDTMAIALSRPMQRRDYALVIA